VGKKHTKLPEEKIMSKIELDYEQRQRVESVLEWMLEFPDEAAAELIYLRDRVAQDKSDEESGDDDE